MYFLERTFVVLWDEKLFSDIVKGSGGGVNVHTPGTYFPDVSAPVQNEWLSEIEVKPRPVRRNRALGIVTADHHGQRKLENNV